MTVVSFKAGERVEVLTMGRRHRFYGEVAFPSEGGAEVLVIREGKSKPLPCDATKVRRLERARPAPPPLPALPRRAPAKLRAQPKPKPPARSDRYRAYVRRHPCVGCGSRTGIEPHHWGPKGRSGGVGQKTDDYRTVPVCRGCHDHLHSSEGAGALPGMNKALTVELFRDRELDLLIAWIVERRHEQVEGVLEKAIGEVRRWSAEGRPALKILFGRIRAIARAA